jgi:hypothetical protein
MAEQKLIQPLPWTFEACCGDFARIRDAHGFAVIEDVLVDEAEFIVTACNNYSALREQVERIKGLSATMRERAETPLPNEQVTSGHPVVDELMAQVEACVTQSVAAIVCGYADKLDALLDPPVGAHHQQEEQK